MATPGAKWQIVGHPNTSVLVVDKDHTHSSSVHRLGCPVFV